MGLMDSLKGQFIDIIESTQSDTEILSHRFERRENEIKMGAKLIVREGQSAVFINEGKLADIFEPGTYTLSTQNLPILSDLKGWKYGFNSPFKAEVYFINRLTIANRKWGTPNPVMMRDKELGVIRLRAFGVFAYTISDVTKFFQTTVGTNAEILASGLETQLKASVVSCLSEALAESQIPAFDLAAKYSELSAMVEKTVIEKFAYYGLQTKQFVIENISLPPEVEALIDKRSGMSVVGNLDQYMKFNMADKAGEALTQGGGLAGSLAGAGLGLAMGGQMANQFAGAMKPAGMPPPLPSDNIFVAIGGQQQGPFSLAQIKQLALDRQIEKESLVWKEGMPAWVAASSMPEIATLFAGVPPKLPS